MAQKSAEFTGRIYCSHLEHKHMHFLDWIEVKLFGVSPVEKPRKDLKGVCLASINGTCPSQHDCKSIVVTDFNPLTGLTIKPVRVHLRQDASDEIHKACKRPDDWFLSARATFERSGLVEVFGNRVENMSWRPFRKRGRPRKTVTSNTSEELDF